MNRRVLFFVSLTAALLTMAVACSSSSDGEVITPPSNPDPPCDDSTANRFVDCGNGTVTDKATGLIWLKDAGCLGRQTWSEARSSAAALADGRCGLTDNSSPGDWRLPTLECPDVYWCSISAASGEFATVLAPDCATVHVFDTSGNGCWSDGDPFLRLRQSEYWSNTPHRGNLNAAWIAFMKSSVIYAMDKSADANVWPVRAGYR
jgi:hypothetical protein